MLAELTIYRTVPPPNGNSPADGIRILSLLPRRWRKDLRQTSGDIVIRVETGDDTPLARIRDEFQSVLENPVFSHLDIARCISLHPFPPQENQ